MTASGEPPLRLAGRDDMPAIDALMKASIRELFPAFYDERQTKSSVAHIGHVDAMLIDDRTYFVVEARGEIVACGGWSRRDKLFTGSTDQEDKARQLDPATEAARVRAMFVRGDWTRRGIGTRILAAAEEAARAEGFRRLELMATLPGYQLYARHGFVERWRGPVALPDGVEIEGVEMEKSLE
jgi:GNAT superfamily N-acetyltransferase